MPNTESSESPALERPLADPRVFDLLGDPIRFRIVRELHDADDAGPLPFSRLRERVEVRDSGRFNYHLDRLEGDLVTKREAGYTLTGTGRAVAGLVDPSSETIDSRATE